MVKLNDAATHLSKRRNFALLGQNVLKNFDSLQFGNVTLYFPSRDSSMLLAKGCAYLSHMCSEVERTTLGMPDDFDEWEDDDHAHIYNEDYDDDGFNDGR